MYGLSDEATRLLVALSTSRGSIDGGSSFPVYFQRLRECWPARIFLYVQANTYRTLRAPAWTGGHWYGGTAFWNMRYSIECFYELRKLRLVIPKSNVWRSRHSYRIEGDGFSVLWKISAKGIEWAEGYQLDEYANVINPAGEIVVLGPKIIKNRSLEQSAPLDILLTPREV